MPKKDKSKLAIYGGAPIRTAPWPSTAKGNILLSKRAQLAAQRVLESKRLFRYDERPYAQTATGKFEQNLCTYFGVKHALAMTSATTAIATGLLAAELPPGSLVACPSFTFAATPSAIILANCKPALIEVDANLHLDINDLRKKYTPKMRAIVAVHMRGMACDIPAIMRFAREKNLIVIEDAAPACGLELKGKKLGTFGHVGTFSMQSDKSINTGEGGFLITNNDDLFARAVAYSGAYVPYFYKHFAQHKINSDLPLQYPLFSFRMDELRAALAAPQLHNIDATLAQQQELYFQVVAALKQFKALQIRQPITPKSVVGNKLVARLSNASIEQTTWFAQALTAEGIDTRAFADPAETNQRVFWNWLFMFKNKTPQQIQKLLPTSYKYISESIDITLFAKLTKRDLRDLVNAIEKVLTYSQQ